MIPADLKEEVSIELDSMERMVLELQNLHQDVSGREPSVRAKTAAAAFIAQFYSGVENILKRISRSEGVSLPTGETWHIGLFLRFCNPSCAPLPELFDADLKTKLATYRKFRHGFHHGYGFQLDWERMTEGIQSIGEVHRMFRSGDCSVCATPGDQPSNSPGFIPGELSGTLVCSRTNLTIPRSEFREIRS